LLFLLDRCGAPCGDTAAGEAPEGAVALISGQKRLQALDFWLRNPDYLADDLLNQVESGSVADPAWALDQTGALLEGDEPEISRYPMVRWRFGAWEALDDALSLLFAHGLIDVVAAAVAGRPRRPRTAPPPDRRPHAGPANGRRTDRPTRPPSAQSLLRSARRSDSGPLLLAAPEEQGHRHVRAGGAPPQARRRCGTSVVGVLAVAAVVVAFADGEAVGVDGGAVGLVGVHGVLVEDVVVVDEVGGAVAVLEVVVVLVVAGDESVRLVEVLAVAFGAVGLAAVAAVLLGADVLARKNSSATVALSSPPARRQSSMTDCRQAATRGLSAPGRTVSWYAWSTVLGER
jgi:hypothetical protein